MIQFTRFLFVFLLFQQILFQCSQSGEEEIVHIPDPDFLLALVELGVDRDGDGLISYPEAEVTFSINLKPSGIADLTGIEAFTNLDSLVILMNSLAVLDLSKNKSLNYLSCIGCELDQLDVSHNPELSFLDCSGGAAMSNILTHLDLSKNSALKILNCASNRLTALELSNNPSLEVVNCGRNQIETMDVSNNRSLSTLLLNNNLLTYIDVSGNPSLTKLITCGNRLSRLDVSGNNDIKVLGVDNMNTIYEVCVWTMPFPPAGTVVLSEYSPNVYFTTNCQN